MKQETLEITDVSLFLNFPLCGDPCICSGKKYTSSYIFYTSSIIIFILHLPVKIKTAKTKNKLNTPFLIICQPYVSITNSELSFFGYNINSSQFDSVFRPNYHQNITETHLNDLFRCPLSFKSLS